MQTQTLDPKIESSLLHRREDRTQAFVHDTHIAFFLAKDHQRKGALPTKQPWDDPLFLESLVFYSGLVADSSRLVGMIRSSSLDFDQKYDLIARAIENSIHIDETLVRGIGKDILIELGKEKNYSQANKAFWDTCITYFQRMGFHRVGNLLCDLLETEQFTASLGRKEDKTVRHFIAPRKYTTALAYILKHFDSPKVLDTFVEYLCSGDFDPYYIIVDAIVAMHKKDPDRVFRAIEKGFVSSYGGDYKYFIRTVGNLRDPRYIDPLIEFYKGSNYWLQRWALDAVVVIDDKSAIPKLQTLLEDTDRDKKLDQFIYESIEKLT